MNHQSADDDSQIISRTRYWTFDIATTTPPPTKFVKALSTESMRCPKYCDSMSDNSREESQEASSYLFNSIIISKSGHKIVVITIIVICKQQLTYLYKTFRPNEWVHFSM